MAVASKDNVKLSAFIKLLALHFNSYKTFKSCSLTSLFFRDNKYEEYPDKNLSNRKPPLLKSS